MNFTKMTGNGNDFIVIENLLNELSAQELSQLARTVCRRKYSIGADGLLVVEKSAKAHFKMRIFNRDGSEGEMCGNGARCICRYASDSNIAPEEMTFETLAGIYKAKVCGCEVKVDMGSIDLSKARYNQIIVLNDSELTYNFLEVGVPHCVV
ncbi:MAG: diaminopimelate epimerase, partial [Tepidanaerobacteraceae bacterium]